MLKIFLSRCVETFYKETECYGGKRKPLRPRHTMRQIAATRRGDKSPRLHCCCDQSLALSLSLRYVAQIQTSLNLCDRSQRQNSVAATMIFTCHTRRFVAATCRGDMSQRFVASCVSALRWLEIYLCGSYVGNRLTRGMLSLTSSLDICLLLYLVCNFLENFIHWWSVNWITPYIPDHPLLKRSKLVKLFTGLMLRQKACWPWLRWE